MIHSFSLSIWPTAGCRKTKIRSEWVPPQVVSLILLLVLSFSSSCSSFPTTNQPKHLNTEPQPKTVLVTASLHQRHFGLPRAKGGVREPLNPRSQPLPNFKLLSNIQQINKSTKKNSRKAPKEVVHWHIQEVLKTKATSASSSSIHINR